MPSQAQPIHVITVDNTPAKAKEFLAGLIKVYIPEMQDQSEMSNALQRQLRKTTISCT
jgi:hypothetical protein